MTCRATGRRPRAQRILVAPGPSPVAGTFSEGSANYHRMNPEAWGDTVESPKVKPGCGLLALGISGSIVFSLGYLAWQIGRAVWS